MLPQVISDGYSNLTHTKIYLITHVSPPNPIDMKKFIANLEFLGLSLGRSPSNPGAKNLSE